MAKDRAKIIATAKDMMGCFVLSSREIDVEGFRLSEQQVIVQNERLFSEILENTVRPGQKEVQQDLSMAYQIGVDKPKALYKNMQCVQVCSKQNAKKEIRACQLQSKC